MLGVTNTTCTSCLFVFFFVGCGYVWTEMNNLRKYKVLEMSGEPNAVLKWLDWGENKIGGGQFLSCHSNDVLYVVCVSTRSTTSQGCHLPVWSTIFQWVTRQHHRDRTWPVGLELHGQKHQRFCVRNVGQLHQIRVSAPVREPPSYHQDLRANCLQSAVFFLYRNAGMCTCSTFVTLCTAGLVLYCLQ